MNGGKATGGIVAGARSAYVPGSFGVPAVRKVLFSVLVRDHEKRASVWECCMEGDPKSMDELEHKGVPGTGVEIEYELAARPYIKRGVHVGDVRFLRITSVRFDERNAVDIGSVEIPVEAANA